MFGDLQRFLAIFAVCMGVIPRVPANHWVLQVDLAEAATEQLNDAEELEWTDAAAAEQTFSQAHLSPRWSRP